MKNTAHSADLSHRKQRIAHHFAQASDYDHHASIQQQVCELLLTRIAHTYQDSVLEVGAGTGQMTRLLAENIQSKHWVINELAGRQSPILQAIFPAAKIMIGDAEQLDLSSNHSLIISANAVQWFDNPLSFIQQSYERLASGGQLLFNTFTPNNFLQIKALTGQGLAYPTMNKWRLALEKSGFKQITLSTHRFDLPFSKPYAVLKHMQLTGVSTNQTATSSNDTPFKWTKARLQQFEREYWQQFAAKNAKGELCVNLTYDVLIINAVKP
ncbi:methyltransferase domain-containing protein [Psychrobacter sp. 16-MNA-CIBAN-0192]|uniref:methyltransferase domain-containing protein n=1 Tax=Psychrobacter sp. 16-MNA-CIBAN-0192 TaxID=3140448 RepID=UPI0033197DC0